MAEPALHIVVHGRVQGVGFRDWTRRAARQIGLAGWCRNRSDGTVEVMVSGPSDELARFKDDIAKGPPPAVVDRLEIAQSDEGGEIGDGFEIRPTA